MPSEAYGIIHGKESLFSNQKITSPFVPNSFTTAASFNKFHESGVFSMDPANTENATSHRLNWDKWSISAIGAKLIEQMKYLFNFSSQFDKNNKNYFDI